MRPLIAALLTAALATPLAAHAWGPDGHRTVATLAQQLIAGKPAAARVAALLGGLTLPQVAVWADCAKGVSPSQAYGYPSPGKFPECAPLETTAGIAEMSDYVRRNDLNCPRQPADESCHKQYHYTDVALQRSRYLLGFTGTHAWDIVGATQAAILMLQGKPAPPPFSFKSRREALLLLTHYLGDIHQPLHVGSVYLDAQGRRVDPDKTGFDPATFTVGGNSIILGKAPLAPPALAPELDAGRDDLQGEEGQGFAFFGPPKLHGSWDGVPTSLDPAHVNLAWVQTAKAVPMTKGLPTDWPAVWASGTLAQSGKAFQGLSFSAKQGSRWFTTLPGDYSARAATIKKQQLTLAGARLAQVLMAAFPN